MNCEVSKGEIETDFLAKTNGKYSVDLQRHLMSCRKCRDHGIALTRILQSAQLDKIEDIPGPLIKKSIDNLVKVPVAKEKGGLRLVHFALGTAAVLMTFFIAYRGLRHKTSYEAQASAPNSASRSTGLPADLLGMQKGINPIFGDPSHSNPDENAAQKNLPEEENGLECNFASNTDGFFADFITSQKKLDAKTADSVPPADTKQAEAALNLLLNPENGYGNMAATESSAKSKKNEGLLSVESLYGLFGGRPAVGKISGLSRDANSAASGSIGGLGSLGGQSIGGSGNPGKGTAYSLGSMETLDATRQNGLNTEDFASGTELASFEILNIKSKNSLDKNALENDGKNTCEMPPAEIHRLLAQHETDE